ncbi:insulinase family protein [Ruficoccus amylovorans]|uniref:Insulinase family protein n=1 Tax=Ruficoccus amylovorans TaxID=1804625 RepID=A0A842HEC1_9BACT|nr:pitrilysin family protein [Ruficoccus amylovorans]MBC2594006.1 insulinase family protein [Ruficoccus amylovorans]
MSAPARTISSDQTLLNDLFRDPVHRRTLPNGLTVVSRQDFSAELVSVQLWVKTGSIHEGDWTGAGLSHFLEHMLFKGTPTRGPLDISREVHAIGGGINAYTSFDRTVYYIDAPSEQAEVAFDILADMGLRATIPDAEFTSERDVILREIDMGLDDPDRELFQAFAQTAFRQHPYRFPVIGLRPLFEQVTREGLYGYYKSRYQPGNMVLVVVGALEDAQVDELAEKYFGDALPGLSPCPVVAAESPQLASRTERLSGDYNIVRGMAGYKIPGLADPAAPALDMLASLLGNGKSSLLWQVLREDKRLVQHIDASCWNPGGQGLLWISYLCDPGRREQVESEIRRVMARDVFSAITKENLAKAVRQALVGEVNGRKTMSGQASRLGVAETVLGELDYPRLYFTRLAALTPDDLKAAARRYLNESGLTEVTLEPKATSSAAGKETARTREVPDFSETTLPNGARLLVQADPSFPKVHLRLALLGGPALDPAEAPGAGGVLASLLTRDTERRGAGEIAAEVDRVGGVFSEFIGNNTFGLSVEVLPADFPLAVSLLGDALLSLRPTGESFEIEREGQLSSLLEDEDEILDYGRRRLRRRFYGKHGFANDYLGTREGLEKLTLAQVETLRGQLVRGPNVVLAVSGAVDESAVKAALEPVLSRLSAEPAPVPAALPSDPVETGTFVERLPREQAVVLEAYPDAGVRDEDFRTGEVLDELLSGMSSRLFETVREKAGLAYYVGACRTPGLDGGMFTLYAGTHPGAVSAVLAEYDREIERLRSGGVTEEELSACRTRLKVQKRQGLQAIGARAMQAALNALYGQPINNTREYPARIDAVTAEAVTDFARRYLAPERRLRLTVEPRK